MNAYFDLFRCLKTALLALLLVPASIFAQSPGQLLTTIKSPVRNFSGFGDAAAPFGTDRFIVGAYDEPLGGPHAGAAFLLNSNGALLTTFTNPTPQIRTGFGDAVAAVGDCILIGATGGDDGSGGAFLFNTNGSLITTFTDPLPGNLQMGYPVVGLGTDRVLIGTPNGSSNGIGAFLFSTNGTLLTCFTNPAQAYGGFGFALDVVGGDKILIGALNQDLVASQSGAAYLFDTNGTLLTTFTNPVVQQAGSFGWTVAALGNDKVAITAFHESFGDVFSGAVFILDLQGNLLATLTNPAPYFADDFGFYIAAVGGDRILVTSQGGATTGSGTGTAYLFNINGTLLHTFTNPAPTFPYLAHGFGQGLAVLGNNRLFIGAYADSTQGLATGAGYIYTTNGVLQDKILSPILQSNAFFGSPVVAFDNTRVLTGATAAPAGYNTINGGEAFLYSINGSFLAVFTSPDPSFNEDFGYSLAPFGRDRVLIGSGLLDSNNVVAGRAYLYDTNGNWLTTFTNPVPASGPEFGISLCASGTNRVVIGAPYENVSVSGSGAVFIFDTNATLLTTIANPTPADGDGFGWRVAALGADRLIATAPYDVTGGAATGIAYLLRINGTILATFTNSRHQNYDAFGFSLATLPGDLIAIGAYNATTFSPNAGAVYLFNTNGTLLQTYTNPVPEANDHFGNVVAAVGSNRLLISTSYQPGNGTNSGKTFLFNTNGALLATFSSPNPQAFDGFGSAIAGVGNDRVVIGDPGYDSGAPDSGAAFVFAVPYPPLNIAKTGGSVVINWVTPETGIVLQQSDRLNPAAWINVAEAASITSQTNAVQQTLVNSNRFFRLHRP